MLAFKPFYSPLYKSEFPTGNTKMNDFLQGLCNSVIHTDTTKQLDSPLSLGEMRNSINAMQSNKAPGLVWVSMEFLKTSISKLAPLLLSMFNESLERGSLPPTLTQATIALLLKEGKDPSSCGS